VGQPPPQPQSRWDDSALAAFAATMLRRQPPLWVWGLVAAVLVTILVVILANR
jgi:hypothetical protein